MRTLLALAAILLLALSAAAQSDPAEFGRASGGTIELITKAPRQTSGSLSLTRSTGGQGYEGTIGGTLLDDRVWFFGAASTFPGMYAKATAQPVDWSNITATWSGGLQPAGDGLKPVAPRSDSFLSLRSTSVISDRMMLNISISRSQ